MFRRIASPWLALAAVIAAAAVAASVACGGNDAKATTIDVELGNWYVKPSVASVDAGKVQFRATHAMEMHGHGMMGNEAGKIHELAVARKHADGSLEVLATAKEIEMGETKLLTLDLEPGEYELQCNVGEEVDGEAVSHYGNGMHAPFTVT